MTFLKSRRRFLQAAATSSVVAPLSLGGLTRMAQASTTGKAKTKVVFFVIGDGFATDSFQGKYNEGLWFPKNIGNAVESENFLLNEMSQELAAYQSQSLYLQGMMLGGGNAGHGGWAEVLRDRNKSQYSIDVILGESMVGTDPSQRSLFAGPHAVDHTNWYVSWNGGNKRTPHANPRLMFENVFGVNYINENKTAGSTGSKGTHLFDPINEDIQLLRSKVSGAEKQKLDTHLDSMEKVVTDMNNTGEITAQCNPIPPADSPIMSPDYRNVVQQSHHQVVATTLSCGVSRVATIQVGRSADQIVIKDASLNANPHDLAHRYKSEQEWKDCRKWYARQAKLFLDELASHADPDVPGDSLLDHTLVVITSEMSDGAPEHQYNMPMLMVGGASGLLNNGTGNGRYYNISQYGDRNHWQAGKQVDFQRVWATLAQAMGTNVPYSGDVSVIPGIFNNVT